jgi:hypothetical protein
LLFKYLYLHDPGPKNFYFNDFLFISNQEINKNDYIYYLNLISTLMKYNRLLFVLCMGMIGCSKGGDSSAPTPTPPPFVVVEPSLTATNGVVIDIDPGATNIYAVVGTSQKIEVKLAAIPASGVTIDTKLIKLSDNTTAFATGPLSSTTLTTPVTVTGLVPGVLYNLSVVVTSKTIPAPNPPNTKTIEFKMAAK